MRSIAIITGFDRPEYMEVTLTQLRECNGARDLHYIFALDYGHNKKNREVIEKLFEGFSYEYLYNNGIRYGLMKQSFNVLESYRYAAAKNPEFVFLIEDDIFCAKSFFDIHYKLHEKEIFCSTACMLQNRPDLHNLSLSDYGYTKDSVYQSLGVCFRTDILKGLVIPHANHQYYRSPRVYLVKNFVSPLDEIYCEQDGLIRRIHDTSGLEIGFPHYPRAYHAGIWGYHRQGENTRGWTHEKKVQFIIDTCFSQHKMQKYNDFNDVFVTRLDV